MEPNEPANVVPHVGRKMLADLDAMPATASDLLVVDQRNDGLKLDSVHMSHSIFQRIGCRRGELTDSSFKYSVFEHCYFHNAKFTNVDFTGSVFIDCNLDEATFLRCNFSYVRFRRTLINADTISPNMPAPPNIRREFLRGLRANARALGRDADMRHFLILELAAERDHYRAQITRSTEWYKDKYTFRDQLKGCLLLSASLTSELIWGYGLKMSRLFLATLMIVFLFGLAIWLSDSKWHDGSAIHSLSFGRALYVSASSLLGGVAADTGPHNFRAEVLALVEFAFGIVLLGLFVTALYRRIAR